MRLFTKNLIWTLPLWLFVILLITSSFNPVVVEGEGKGDLVHSLWEFKSWLPGIVEPARSRPAIFFLSGLLAAAGVFSNPGFQADPKRLRVLLVVLLANAVLLTWTGMFFKFLGNGQILGKYGNEGPYFFATFYYKNHWAAYALLYCGVAASFFFRDLPNWFNQQKGSGSGALALTAIIIIGLTLPIVGSRSGMLLLAIFSVSFLIVFLRYLKDQNSSLKRTIIISMAPLLAVVFMFLSYSDLLTSWRRTESQFDRANSLIFDEIRILHGPEMCLRMFNDRPIWGWGYRSFDPLFSTYATEFFQGKEDRLGDIMEFAHNDWLQGLSEFGTVGFSLLILGIFLIFRINHVNTSSTSTSDRHNKYLHQSNYAFWSLNSLLLLCLLATWDFPFSNPAVLANSVLLFIVGRRLNLRHVGYRQSQVPRKRLQSSVEQ